MGKLLKIFTILVILVAIQSSQADFINGGFETDNYTGWDTIGVATIETAAFGTGPTEGTFQSLVSNQLQFPLPDLEAFLGLSHSLSDLNQMGVEVFNGAAIKQNITVDSGDMLKFDWNFLTEEHIPADDPVMYANDFAFVSIDDTAYLLADTFFPTFQPGPFGLFDQTGFNTFSYTFTTAGTHTVGVGVVNVLDEEFYSIVITDNFMIKSIPEPASAMILGLGSLIFYLRRKR